MSANETYFMYRTFRGVRELLRAYFRDKSSCELPEFLPDVEERLVVCMDLERALKRLTPREKTLIMQNCMEGTSGWILADQNGIAQSRISGEVRIALCKMSAWLCGEEYEEGRDNL